MVERDALAADRRPLEELLATAMAETQLDEDPATDALGVLLWRSGPGLLEAAIALTQSLAWMERELGVDLLG